MSTISSGTAGQAGQRSARRAATVAQATPVDRDRYVDFLRLVSIAVVVLGHWALVLVVLDGTTALGRSTPAALSTWLLMVMPLFFAVGGYAHARTLGSARRRWSYAGFVSSRVNRLMGPVIAMLGVWVLVAAGLDVAGLARGPIAVAADRAPTPLWFIAVYLVVSMLAPVTYQLHRRAGVLTLSGMVGLVAVVDVLRMQFSFGPAGWASVLAVWLAVHQIGYFWSDGSLTRRGVPALMAIGGFGAAAVLTFVTGWYPVDMQGLPGSDASNFAPPTFALLAQGVGIVGLALVVRRPLTRWLDGDRPWALTVAGNRVIMTVFCWHLSAAFAVVGIMLLLGITLPAALTPAWWLLLPAWYAACAAVLGLLVAALQRAERWSPLGDGQPPTATAVVLGTATLAVSLFVVSQVGLDGLVHGAQADVLGVDAAAWPALLAGVAALAVLRPAARPR